MEAVARPILKRILAARHAALLARQPLPNRVEIGRDDARVLVRWFEVARIHDYATVAVGVNDCSCDDLLAAGFMLFGCVFVVIDGPSTFRVWQAAS